MRKNKTGQGITRFTIQYTPEARLDLDEIHDYIELHSTRRTARNYISRIRTFCRTLAIAPHRGEDREPLRPGLRSIGFEGRVSVLFAVFDKERLVEIQAINYGGRQVRKGK